MGASVTIILTGITYMMLTPPQDPTDLRVALVRQDTSAMNKQGFATPRHVPYIMANPNDLAVTTQRVPDYVVTHNATTQNIYVVRETVQQPGEILTLKNVKTNKLTIPTTPSDNPDREPFFRHVPNIQIVCPTCALLTAADIDTPKFKSTGLGATLRITGGRLAAKRDAIDCWWDFPIEGMNPKPPTMQLAQQVAVDFEVDDGKGLVIVRNNSVKTEDQIIFKNQDISVTIGSAPIEDILLVEPAADHAPTDEHFDLYYGLLEGTQPIQHPVPIRGMCGGGIQHHLGGANCPPVVQK